MTTGITQTTAYDYKPSEIEMRTLKKGLKHVKHKDRLESISVITNCGDKEKISLLGRFKWKNAEVSSYGWKGASPMVSYKYRENPEEPKIVYGPLYTLTTKG